VEKIRSVSLLHTFCYAEEDPHQDRNVRIIERYYIYVYCKFNINYTL